MSYRYLLVEPEQGVARITLNRREVLNSFNREMARELCTVFDGVGGDETIRAVLLTGAGRGFCAGQDLAEASPRPDGSLPDLGDFVRQGYNPIIRAVRTLEKPVVCGVNGVAAGAGANLALACDIVIAARSASFIEPFCKLGLIPDTGGTYFLPRLVGTARAMGLAMLGEKLPAEQAAAWGLIWKCVDDDVFTQEVETLATHFAAAPTKGLARTKQAIYGSAGNSLDQQLDAGRDFMRELGSTSDYREGVAAFMTKRAPVFTGE